MSLLQVEHLSKSFGGVRALRDVSLRIEDGKTVGLIGPNGAGKTTLFNLITGIEKADSGAIRLDGRDVLRLGPAARASLGIVRTFQHGRIFGNLTVLENLLVGAHTRRLAAEGFFWPKELLGAFLPFALFAKQERTLVREAEELLSLFGERLLPRKDDPAYSLSYANRRRVEIARALFAHPGILFLDEPTAGMNPSETAEMVELISGLKRRNMTMVIIEHKLPLVLPLSDSVIVMDDGEKIAEGEPLSVSVDPRVIEAYLGHTRTVESPAKEEPDDGNDRAASDAEVY